MSHVWLTYGAVRRRRRRRAVDGAVRGEKSSPFPGAFAEFSLSLSFDLELSFFSLSLSLLGRRWPIFNFFSSRLQVGKQKA